MAKDSVNILLVDDQPGKLLSYEAILANSGETLLKANSGREALECLLKKDIAVVLVDVCMPELDGFELASMIRTHPRFQKTAIILVSGVMVEDVDRLRGYVSGAVDYVSVPIVPEILKAKVAVFADLYRKTEALERLNRELEHRVLSRTQEIQSSLVRLRESEEKLRLVLSTGGIQGWSWDISRRELTFFDPADDSIVVPQAEADFLAGLHPDDRAAVQDALRRAFDGGGDFAAEFRTRDHVDERWWLGRGTVIRGLDGAPQSIAGINMDITARKRAETERTTLLLNAESARREAERANRIKDEFLAVLSHELRTPLNSISGWAHMLQAGGLDAETQASAVETISRNAQLQAQLISDLLDVSRISAGTLRLNPEPVEFHTVVHAAVNVLRPLAEGRQVTIDTTHISAVPVLQGDPGRLQQVIWNLLSNAIKFSPAGACVHVRLANLQSHVDLVVEDEGAGIKPDFLPFIFEPFRQADSSSSRRHQGLGLGLAISRRLIEMHGGSIQAANRHGAPGAVFRVVLPLSLHVLPRDASHDTSSFATSGSLPAGRPLRDRRVLVVDDEPDAREFVALMLQQCGAATSIAGSAAEAFELLKENRPDVLVVDIAMPGEDGFSFLRRVRDLPARKGGRTPAIALTAYAGAQDRTRMLDAGFNRHVPKPVRPSELVDSIVALTVPPVSSDSTSEVAEVSPEQHARSANGSMGNRND